MGWEGAKAVIKQRQTGRTILTPKKNELRIFSEGKTEVYITTGIVGAEKQIRKSVEIRSKELGRLIKETKRFSEIEFIEDESVARVRVEEGGCTVEVECPIKEEEEYSPSVIEGEIVVELDIDLIKEIIVKDIDSVEIEMDRTVKIRGRGRVRVEGEQKEVNYIKKKEGRNLFILGGEEFQEISKIVRAGGRRVIIGVTREVIVFYIYYKDLTVICYAGGTLIRVG